MGSVKGDLKDLEIIASIINDERGVKEVDYSENILIRTSRKAIVNNLIAMFENQKKIPTGYSEFLMLNFSTNFLHKCYIGDFEPVKETEIRDFVLDWCSNAKIMINQ
ncbi:hypothetical protein [Chryseobacterium taklimakanense]|uniref:Uncharacterized protein n=1 Tax=Chryseobacterium taklimakanense TaxID=536441 RepID=A0A3G8WKH6_9FLAO|nr:hypothetical protein [Chryseobacterium taklimakanense]AZI20728.1 hypothetical protein EIH08_08430 [Chryseobacterium taklimakanense]